MMFFDNENDARTEIVNILKPVLGNAHLFVAERNAINIGLREVIFVVRMQKDDAKSENAVNALFIASLSQSERLEWQGSKMDFLNDNETEYLMIKAVVENG